jgi:AraC family transcriptional regulator
MSYSDYKARELFYAEKKEVLNTIGTDYYSMQLFSPTFFYDNFNPTAAFEYWTALQQLILKIFLEWILLQSAVALCCFLLIRQRMEPAAFEYILLLGYRVPSMF